LTREIHARQEVDVAAALTTPLPVTVIARMRGIPEHEHTHFKRWSNAIVGIQDGPLGEDPVQTLLELRSFFAATVAERRASPGDDLISALTQVSETSETLTDEQIVGIAILLMIARNETPTTLLGNLLDRLAAQPEVWAALREDRSRIQPAIEESLRLDAPAQMIMRRTTREVTVGDVTKPEGQPVMAYLAAATRDPSR